MTRDYRITGQMLCRETQRIAFSYGITRDFQFPVEAQNIYTTNSIMLRASNDGKIMEITFNSRQLEMSLDDLSMVIQKEMKRLLSRDLAFLHDDYT